jgi:hypothetical protein
LARGKAEKRRELEGRTSRAKRLRVLIIIIIVESPESSCMIILDGSSTSIKDNLSFFLNLSNTSRQAFIWHDLAPVAE